MCCSAALLDCICKFCAEFSPITVLDGTFICACASSMHIISSLSHELWNKEINMLANDQTCPLNMQRRRKVQRKIKKFKQTYTGMTVLIASISDSQQLVQEVNDCHQSLRKGKRLPKQGMGFFYQVHSTDQINKPVPSRYYISITGC